MNIFFLFGQAAWIPETKPNNESNEENFSSSYGTFVPSNVSVNRYSLARDRQVQGEEGEIVLNSTEWLVMLSRRE